MKCGPNVRLSAALAVVATALLYVTWPWLSRWLANSANRCSARDSRGGNHCDPRHRRQRRPVRAMGRRADVCQLRGVGRAWEAAARGDARPREAGQRPGARKPHQADFRRPQLRQLRRPPEARRCTIRPHVRRPARGIRGARHPGRARGLSAAAHPLDVRRPGDDRGRRPRGADGERPAGRAGARAGRSSVSGFEKALREND